MTERKYPKPFEPQENQIYKITPIGGLKDDGSRWANPRVIDIKNISKKTGKPYTSHLINCIIEEINVVDKKWEEGKSAERGWFLPYDIVEEVRTLVDDYKEKYPFFYRLKVGIDKETKKAKKIHQIFTTLSELKDIQPKIIDVKPLQQDGDIAYILEFVSNIDNTLNMILNTILEWRKDEIFNKNKTTF